MKCTYTGREKNEVTFKMDVTAEEFQAAVVKAYASSKEKYAVDGFRKGKAPRKIIEAKYGDDVFYEDAINQLFAEIYPKALDELNLDPVDRPSVDFDEIDAVNGFGITVKITVAPVVEVKDYKGIKVSRRSISAITDEDVAKGSCRTAEEKFQNGSGRTSGKGRRYRFDRLCRFCRRPSV